MGGFPHIRPRRLRQAPWIRALVRETQLAPSDLILACVVSDTAQDREPVAALPGVDRLSLNALAETARRAQDLGVPALAVFPHIDPKLKDAEGSEALNPNGLVCQAIRTVKDAAPGVGVITDVALDPYTTHGHDGVLHDGRVLNDETVERLVECALVQAQAGADMVAPSDMMDGRIGAIREALEGAGHADTLILSYAAKYASGFYGPYREAIGSATALQGDKQTYQMDPANRGEALSEVSLDIAEGADVVMVKPGLPYLDIIARLSDSFETPVFAFQVSGEYAMIKAADRNGWIDGDRVMMEALLAFKRAGAHAVVTYAALDAADALQRG